SDRAPQLWRPLVEGVLVERRVLNVVLEAADDRRRGGPIGVAHAQVDHVAAGGDGGFLLPVDLGEEIRGELLQPFGLHEGGGRHRTVVPRVGAKRDRGEGIHAIGSFTGGQFIPPAPDCDGKRLRRRGGPFVRGWALVPSWSVPETHGEATMPKDDPVLRKSQFSIFGAMAAIAVFALAMVMPRLASSPGDAVVRCLMALLFGFLLLHLLIGSILGYPC